MYIVTAFICKIGKLYDNAILQTKLLVVTLSNLRNEGVPFHHQIESQHALKTVTKFYKCQCRRVDVEGVGPQHTADVWCVPRVAGRPSGHLQWTRGMVPPLLTEITTQKGGP